MKFVICILSSKSCWSKKLFELRVTLYYQNAALQQSHWCKTWKSPGELRGKTMTNVLWVPVLKSIQGKGVGWSLLKQRLTSIPSSGEYFNF